MPFYGPFSLGSGGLSTDQLNTFRASLHQQFPGITSVTNYPGAPGMTEALGFTHPGPLLFPGQMPSSASPIQATPPPVISSPGASAPPESVTAALADDPSVGGGGASGAGGLGVSGGAPGGGSFSMGNVGQAGVTGLAAGIGTPGHGIPGVPGFSLGAPTTGSTVGGLVGTVAGAALGVPFGGIIGSGLGGMIGQAVTNSQSEANMAATGQQGLSIIGPTGEVTLGQSAPPPLAPPSVSPNMGFGIGTPGSTAFSNPATEGLGPFGEPTGYHTAANPHGLPTNPDADIDLSEGYVAFGATPSAPGGVGGAPGTGAGEGSTPAGEASGQPGGPGGAPGGEGAPGTGAGEGSTPGGEASGQPGGPGGAPGGEGGSGGGGAGGSTVICTELYRQGLMPQVIWEADRAFGRQLDPAMYAGYCRWAPAVAWWMRQSRIVTALIRVPAMAWAYEMACVMGVPGARGSLLGKLIMYVGGPVCRMLGRRAVLAHAR